MEKKYTSKKFKSVINTIKLANGLSNQAGFHIVIGDGNVEKENIQWCYDNYDGTSRNNLSGELNEKLYNNLIKLTEREIRKCIKYAVE